MDSFVDGRKCLPRVGFLVRAEGFGILAARRDRTVRYRTQVGDSVQNIERELAAGAFDPAGPWRLRSQRT